MKKQPKKQYTKFVWLLVLVLIAANGVYLRAAYRSAFNPEHIKSQPAFKQRIEKTESAIRTQAAQLLPASVYAGGPSDQKTPAFETFYTAIQSQNIFRVKVWSPGHQILWSNATEDIGKSFPDNHEVTEALSGETAVELQSTSTKGEQASEHQYSGFTEVYVPIAGPQGAEHPQAVIEVYQAINDILAQVKQSFYHLAAATIGASALIAALGFWFAWHQTRPPAKKR